MFKHLFQAVVFFFAIYAFVFVPLGEKTALEHVRAIAGTPAAKTAATELTGGVNRLVHELRNEARRVTEASDEKSAGEEPEKPAKATPEHGATPAPEEKPNKPAAASGAPNAASN